MKKKVNDLENGVKTAEQTGRETTRAIGTLTSGADATKRDVDGLRKMHIELDKKVDKMLGATRSATANQTKSREFKLWYLTGNEVSNFSEIRKVVGSPQDSNGNAAAEIFAIRYYTKNLKKAWEVITEHAIKMQRAGIRLPDDWRPEPMAPDAQFGEEALVIVIKSFMESGS
ncbi:MAG: hypothetical protein HY472_01510 [Candidatus Sungbacteria bacterium]|nr:hypothetical protein [Candidatus Sungbacteria bacterium]